MYADAHQLPNGITLTGYDICIAGAGAAGIALATRLIGSSKKVLLVCSGSDNGANPNPDPTLESRYEGMLGAFMQSVDPIFLTRSRLNMYGGTTNHFWFWARPLDEADLKPRPGYRDAAWPLEMAELNRYYPDANVFGNYGPFNYDDINFWATVLRGTPFPATPQDALRNAIFHAQPDNNIHQFQVRYGAVLKAAPNVTVLFNANVLTIESSADKNHVTGLACATLDNGKPDKHFRIETGAYVLAQGGIESVRLLMLSGNLADNAAGHLGRGFMVQPVIASAAQATFAESVPMQIQNFFAQQIITLAGPQEPDGQHTPIHTPIAHPGELPSQALKMQVWGVLMPTAEAMDYDQIGNFRAMLSFVTGSDGKQVGINLNWEQVPNEESRLSLDENKTDPVFNQPVVRLDWNMLEQEKRTIRRGLALCEQYLKERGATDFEILTDLSGGPEHWTFAPPPSAPPPPPNAPQPWLWAGDHHMGATRMAARAEDGIVDPDLKAHTLDNLYVLSTSVWPTAGCANPTLTLVALALRLGDHLQTK